MVPQGQPEALSTTRCDLTILNVYVQLWNHGHGLKGRLILPSTSRNSISPPSGHLRPGLGSLDPLRPTQHWDAHHWPVYTQLLSWSTAIREGAWWLIAQRHDHCDCMELPAPWASQETTRAGLGEVGRGGRRSCSSEGGENSQQKHSRKSFILFWTFYFWVTPICAQGLLLVVTQ